MLTSLRSFGMRAHLAVGPKAIRALLAAAHAGGCAPLRNAVHNWMDISDHWDPNKEGDAPTPAAPFAWSEKGH
jgi:hypothetical protein